MAKRSIPRDAPRAKVLTLADVVAVTHTIGSRVTKVTGADLAKLIDATRHLHDPDETSDYINPSAIAIELDGVAEVLTELNEDARISALSYLSEQLRRLSNRVAALAPRGGNAAPNWYAVEVKK